MATEFHRDLAPGVTLRARLFPSDQMGAAELRCSRLKPFEAGDRSRSRLTLDTTTYFAIPHRAPEEDVLLFFVLELLIQIQESTP